MKKILKINNLTILITIFPAAYLKAAEGLEGEAETGGVHGTELWALAVGASAAILLLIVLLVLLCFAHRLVIPDRCQAHIFINSLTYILFSHNNHTNGVFLFFIGRRH